MHELGIASSVLEAVREEIRRHPGAVPVKVGLAVGELAGVDPECLQFNFQALTKGTEWEGLSLEILWRPRRHRCPACGAEFHIADYNFTCPACGAQRTECVSGDELELMYLEVEQP